MEMKDKIYQLRHSLGLMLEEVAQYVGVGKSTVRKWETGDIANMRRDKIARLAAVLHTTPAYLMGWNEEAAAPKDDGLDDLDRKLMMLLSRLSEDQKKLLLAQIEVLLKTQG